MRRLYSKLFLLALFMLSAISVKAEVILLEEGVGAAGPAEGGTADYKFIAPRDGVFSITTTFTGAYWGTYSINGQAHSLSSSSFVKEGDTALITITCEEDNTDNTISVMLTDVEEGMSEATAISLTEGNNDIKAMKSGDIPMWYKYVIPSQKRGKLTFTGYPTLKAYAGEDLSIELGTDNPVDYINSSDEDVTVHMVITSTNSEALTATLQYLAPVEDLTYFNSLAFSITDGGSLPKGDPITITFPNRQGGDDNEKVTVSYYIFNVVGTSPTGAPINLGGETEATGTLSGVDINYNFAKGHKYQLKLQSINCGNHYAPGPEEPMISNDAIIFTVTAESGIEIITSEDTSTPLYNIAGQMVNANEKGIIIVNGRKIVRN